MGGLVCTGPWALVAEVPDCGFTEADSSLELTPILMELILVTSTAGETVRKGSAVAAGGPISRDCSLTARLVVSETFSERELVGAAGTGTYGFTFTRDLGRLTAFSFLVEALRYLDGLTLTSCEGRRK